MNRRISILLLSVILIMGLAGCGNNEQANLPTETDTETNIIEEQSDKKEAEKIKIPEPDGEYLLKKETHFDENGEPFSMYESYYDSLGKKSFQMSLFYNDQKMKETFAYSGQTIPDSWGYMLAYDYGNGEAPTRSRIVQGTTLTGEPMSYGYTLYTYDSYGNLIEAKEYDETNSLTYFYKFQYDGNHNRIREEMYNKDNELVQFVSDVYNSEGLHVSGESGKAPNIATHKYEYKQEKDGSIVRQNYLNEKYSGSTTYEYDSHGNLIKMTSKDEYGAVTGWTQYEHLSLSDHLAQTQQPSSPVEFSQENPDAFDNNSCQSNFNDMDQNDDIIADTVVEKTVQGTIVSTNEAFPSWKILLSENILYSDDFGEFNCDELYFYDETNLNGVPISDYCDSTVVVTGILENYRGVGTIFISAPKFIKLISPIEKETVENTAEPETEVVSREDMEKKKLDDAGVPMEFRFESYVPYPLVTLSGYAKDSMTFIPDEKIAIKGYWEDDRWDIIEKLSVSMKVGIEKGKRYTLSGELRYDNLQAVQIIEAS